jgi:hypothetical protein
MPYATVDNLNAQLQHVTISDSSDPTSAEVTQMILEVENEMNARFNAVGITVPVTDSDKLEVVKAISINGGIAKVLRSIEIESEGAMIHQRLFEEAMKNIEKRPQIIEETSQIYQAPGGSEERGTPRFSREGNEW